MGQAVTDAPEVLDTDRANLEAVPPRRRAGSARQGPRQYAPRVVGRQARIPPDRAITRPPRRTDLRRSVPPLRHPSRGGPRRAPSPRALSDGARRGFAAIKPAGEGERSPHLRWPALRRGPRVHRRGDGATRAFRRLPRHDRGAGLGPRDRSRTRRSPSSARPRPGAGHASCSPYAGRAVRVHRHHRAGRWARPHGLAAGRGMGPVHRHGDPREHPIRRIPRPRAAAHVAGRRAQPRRRASLRPAVAPRSAGCVRRRGGITTWITVQIALLRVLHVLQGLYLAVGAATVALAIWTHLARRRAVLTRCRPGSDTRADG